MGRLWKRSTSSLASSWLIGEQLEAFLTWPPDWTGIRNWLDPIADPLVTEVKLDFLEAGKLHLWHGWDFEIQKVLTSERLKVSFHQFHLAWQHVIVEQHVKIISVENCSLICPSLIWSRRYKGFWQQPDSPVNDANRWHMSYYLSDREAHSIHAGNAPAVVKDSF